MKNLTKRMLFLTLMIFGFTLVQAQTDEATVDKTEVTNKDEMNVIGDPGKGMFFIYFYLPKDAKKTIWTVTDEKGKVLIKEKYKNLKAGKNSIKYNYLHGPDGEHTFTITADKTFTLTKKVTKKKKK